MKFLSYILLSCSAAMAAEAMAQKIDLNNHGKWVFQDPNLGEVFITERITDAGSFADGLAPVKIKGKWGYIDKYSSIRIQPEYDNAEDFSNGLAAVSKGKQWGFVNTDGELVIPISFSNVSPFSEDRSRIKINGLYGYIDKEGNAVIAPSYPEASVFSMGVAAVKNKNGKWGYIDKDGKTVVNFSFDDMKDFENGVVKAKINGKWVYLDTKGNAYNQRMFAESSVESMNRKSLGNQNSSIARRDVDYASAVTTLSTSQGTSSLRANETLTDYLRRNGNDPDQFDAIYQRRLNEWERRGEFEDPELWKERTSPANREKAQQEIRENVKAEIAAKIKPFVDSYLRARESEFLQQEFYIGEYDIASQTFPIYGSRMERINLNVPIEDAPRFKERWDRVKLSVAAEFIPSGDDVTISSIRFANLAYNFPVINNSSIYSWDKEMPADNLALNTPAPETPAETTPAEKAVEVAAEPVLPPSDIDINIPQAQPNSNTNTFVVIISNENYQEAGVSNVEFALRDGESFHNYCIQSLGIPEKNIRWRKDATLNQMRSSLYWLSDIGEAFGEDAQVIFYYAGHGVPNDTGTSGYLLPTDGFVKDLRSAYGLEEIYTQLGELPVNKATIFLDACFSGAQRDGGMLMAARGVAIKARPLEPRGNMIVFSAAQADETAYPYRDQRHGLFTYFLLKKLQQTGGQVNYSDLRDYITTNVSRFSILENAKSQTPSVSVSPNVKVELSEISLLPNDSSAPQPDPDHISGSSLLDLIQPVAPVPATEPEVTPQVEEASQPTEAPAEQQPESATPAVEQ